MSILLLNKISYQYSNTNKAVLKDLFAEFEKGKLYCIVGKSGAGKSTLLSLVSGLDLCSRGTILYNNTDIQNLNRDNYRAKNIGVIFQSNNLLTNATAIENIVLAMNISGDKTRNKNKIALELLQKIGIDKETANRKVLKLSGGEQQRVGITRAISHNPDIIIADEPTGNLDQETEASIMKTFTKLAHEENKCVIIVSHSKNVAEYADVVYLLISGRLKENKNTE